MSHLQHIELTATHADLTHFLTLAARGAHPAASGGETRANRLAESALEHAAGLDESAAAGAAAFLWIASRSYQTAADALESGQLS